MTDRTEDRAGGVAFGDASEPTRDRSGRPLGDANDDAALNGGAADHWYVAGRTEKRPPRRRALVTLLFLIGFGGLALALAFGAAAA
jgi:hypothetical protein